MAIGIDTTNPAGLHLPFTPDYVFGYINGAWPSFAALHAKYPSAIPVSITVGGMVDADFADIERGDYTPQTGATWALWRHQRGFRPGLYCSWSDWPSVIAACAAVGLRVSDVDWWLAAYPGNGQILYPGTIGHQWQDFGPWDQSVVLPGWRPSSAPTPPPAAPPAVVYPPSLVPGEPDMASVAFSCTTDASGNTEIGIPLPPGTTRVLAASVDLLSVYAGHGWDSDAFAFPAVGGKNPGEVIVRGIPNHFYTGHAICGN